MAVSTTVRGKATFVLAVGASYLLIALWDLSDEAFGSSSGGALGRVISIWLFHTFGHWGPRVALITIGLLFVALSFKLASLAREDEAPSDSGTKRSAVLSWTLVLLVFSLLAFIVVGPFLRNPTIDGVLSSWRERYYTPATALTVAIVSGFILRLRWKDFRAGDPWELPRMLMWLVAAIFFFAFFVLLTWKAIFGTA